MNCRKYQKLIHRMYDGDLDEAQTKAVCAHLEECPECRQMHAQLVSMCEALKEADREAPAGFRQRWQAHLADAPQTGKRSRAGLAVPVAACCLAAVLGISTLLNPQAFGLEGKSLTSEWFAVRPSALLEESAPPADPGPGQRVSSVSTTQKKPNLLDYDSSNYSETTTKSSSEPALYEAGVIEPAANAVAEGFETLLDEAGEALPAAEPAVFTVQPGEDTLTLLAEAEAAGCTVETGEDRTVIEGTPEQMAGIAASLGLEIPEDTQLIQLVIE